MKKIFFLAIILFPASIAFCQLTNVLLDYDAVDELISTDQGAYYERELWHLNSNLPDTSTERGLTWAVVKFDTLYDANTEASYPISDKELTIDSLRIFFTHQNVTGTPDVIFINIYQYIGAAGLELDSLEQITNPSVYDTFITATTSLTTQIEALTIRPDLQLAVGERFLVGVHFIGDPANTFSLLSGYADYCNFACPEPSAGASAFASNSHYRIVYWDGPIRFTGVNSVAFDCDGDTVSGEPDECELFTIQNFAIQAYVSFMDTGVPVMPVSAAGEPCRVYPNPATDVATVELPGSGSPSVLLLYSSQGKLLLTQSVIQRATIDLSALPAGMYLVVVQGSSYSIMTKLVKN